MRNPVISIVLILSFMGCQPTGDDEKTLDLESARQRIQAEAAKDEARETMMRVMQPEPSQATLLDQAYTARDDAVGAWLAGEKGQRLIALEAEMRVAAHAKDLSGVRAATAQATPLRNTLRELVASHQSAILDVLSPLQQRQWAGYEVASALLALMEPLELTPEQIAAIEQGGPTALVQATAAAAVNPKAEAFLALEQWVEDAVLSAAQVAQYAAIKKTKPLRSLAL